MDDSGTALWINVTNVRSVSSAGAVALLSGPSTFLTISVRCLTRSRAAAHFALSCSR